MARARGVLRRPLDHVIHGIWPHARLDGNVAAAVVQRMAALLAADLATSGKSQRAFARKVGADDTTLGAILNGTRWPDLVTVINISAVLRHNLLQLNEVLLSDSTLHVFTDAELRLREPPRALAE